MAKTELARTSASKEDSAEAPPDEAAAPKKGLVKSILSNRKLLILIAGGLLIVLLGAGAGIYFFLAGGQTQPQLADANPAPVVAPQVAYFDMPDMVVNIQSADGTPAYLKLGVSLELNSANEKSGLEALKPRLVDQFQEYLRELRVEDLRGSAGVLRLKEELLRRTNVAAAPFKVKDVLLKEMIVQ